jgi:hypothetical protein
MGKIGLNSAKTDFFNTIGHFLPIELCSGMADLYQKLIIHNVKLTGRGARKTEETKPHYNRAPVELCVGHHRLRLYKTTAAAKLTASAR